MTKSEFSDNQTNGWALYDYVEPSGRVPFLAWRAGLPATAQAFIDARLLQMRAMRKWSEKWASKYQETDKIIELRVTFAKVQYRPLGAYGANYSFVLLGGDIEKNGKLPTGTIDAVIRRHRDLEAKIGHVREHSFD